ncbi:MAG: type II secretion system protein GspG [Spirochaetota bacterium]|nr:type II secretion system protein GspG [Spirochaetota bacterium]
MTKKSVPLKLIISIVMTLAILFGLVVYVNPFQVTYRYLLEDIPFCSVNERLPDSNYQHKPSFKNTHILINNTVNGFQPFLYTDYVLNKYHINFYQFFEPDEVLLAWVTCPKNVKLNLLAKNFTEKNIPKVCNKQKLLFIKRVKLEKSEKAKSLGYDGIVRIPKVNLACERGKSIQENNFTLDQILSDFYRGMEIYLKKYQNLPGSLKEYESKIKLKPLPKDPWGSMFRFSASRDSYQLFSSGKDKKPGTKDDFTVITCQLNSEKTSFGNCSYFGDNFNKEEYLPSSGYIKYLKKRGVHQDIP